MIPKSKNSMIQKPVSFLAPGQLAKDHNCGKKTLNVANGSKRIEAAEQRTNNLCNHRRTGGNGVHNLFVHYGEDKCEERNITEESSFLDVLSICQSFIDIYTFGIKITDENGKTLKNDKDLLGLLKEQENVEDISIYLHKDSTVQPFLFKLHQDNPSLVRDVITKDGSHGEKSVEGPNHECWSRHLEKTVRDKQICPIRVLTWKDVTESEKQHMWAMVKECFFNPDMDLYREHTLEHMSINWTAWRSSLNTKYVKPCETKGLALKNNPPGLNANDWAWLVTEKFLSDKFKKISSRNFDKRFKGVMNHQTGSQPHRQIIYEMGGKEDAPLDIAKIFYATRQKNGKFVEPREQEKYASNIKELKAKLHEKEE